jgi:ppGpp synthetase/RelA/SpoT-type nucleotidyltranferase
MAYSLDRDNLERDYALRLPLFTSLEQEGVNEIEVALARENVKYHSVTSRVKTIKSLCDKAEAKELGDPLTELTDIVGIRIVALFLGDIEKILTLLQKTFDVQHIDNKIEKGDLARFGYMSVHLLAKIKASFAGTRYDAIKPLVFEIQIRTIAMDAWASASHYLDYKSEEDIPADLKRDFHALSGLFYVADKHFEMFFRNRQATVKEVKKLSRSNDLLGEVINFDTLSAYLNKRYPDRAIAEASQISRLVTSLWEAGYKTLEKLEAYLNAKAEYLERKEKTRNRGPFNQVGVVRVSFSDDPNFEPDVFRPDIPSAARKLQNATGSRQQPAPPR